jgi:hypothetical protein
MARMEQNELSMLAKSLESIRTQPVRHSVRRMAFAYAFFESAIRYAEAGRHWRSLGKLARSILWWPFPFRLTEVKRPLERFRVLAVLLLRLAGMKPVPKESDDFMPPELHLLPSLKNGLAHAQRSHVRDEAGVLV